LWFGYVLEPQTRLAFSFDKGFHRLEKNLL
jgi:hypothetical protein